MLDVQKLVEEILDRAKRGELTEEQAQAAIRKLLDEAGHEAAQRVERDSDAEERIKSAAHRARSMAS